MMPHTANLSKALSAYWRLMRFDKPIGIFILLWPALWALWIAGKGHPDPQVTLIIVLGTILMRAAGCVINDYADRNFDPFVERTRLRPIAAGEISPKSALWLFVALCLIAFALVLTLNPLTIGLSVPAAFLAASYPFTKRFTNLPQAYLGISFAWAVPMSYAAQLDTIPQSAWFLFAATAIWALIYDTMYAMVDRDDDLRIGVKSTAILFGNYDRLIIGILQILMLSLLAAAGITDGLGPYYWLSLGFAGLLFIYQQWLIRNHEKGACFKAFLNNNWFGLVVFLGVMLNYLTPD